jgi:hypothetical protein
MEANCIEHKSQELKNLLARYSTQNFLGHLSFLMSCITNGCASDELNKLSSPMRQLYYLAGLLTSIKEDGTNKIQPEKEEWVQIVNLLIDIENAHYKLFIPENYERLDYESKRKIKIAMPTFLSYFNLGPLNFEEQIINEIISVYSKMDDVINESTGLSTADFILFYENLDEWCQYNFKSLTQTWENCPTRDNWTEYTNLELGVYENTPNEIKEITEERMPMYALVMDPGIKCRFKPLDLAVNGLSAEKVLLILSLLSIQRDDKDFLYYTSLNPLSNKPIIDLQNGLFQVFEEKRVLHAIRNYLESICKRNEQTTSRLSHHKGNYLEDNIVELFRKFFGKNAEILKGYYIDGCEQDIMILWKNFIFIIESKAYTNKEPFRDTEKAFKRIKQDFDRSIGYAHKQAKRVENKFKEGLPFNLTDKNGNTLKTISPTDYKDNDFYIIVNQEAFGQIQVDLSTFLEIDEEDNYPWAVRFDDLETFILTLIAKKKKPQYFIDFLIFREFLHGHITCMDEGEICGGYLMGALTHEIAESNDMIVCTPELASVFDEQYRKGMGFKNEKYWEEKHDKKTTFW